MCNRGREALGKGGGGGLLLRCLERVKERFQPVHAQRLSSLASSASEQQRYCARARLAMRCRVLGGEFAASRPLRQRAHVGAHVIIKLRHETPCRGVESGARPFTIWVARLARTRSLKPGISHLRHGARTGLMSERSSERRQQRAKALSGHETTTTRSQGG